MISKLVNCFQNGNKQSEDLIKITERAKKNAVGFNIVSNFVLEKRDLIKDFGGTSGDTRKSLLPIQDKFIGEDKILKDCTTFSKVLNGVKIPYISSGNVDWKRVGFSLDFNPTLQTKATSLKRLTTYVNVSQTFLFNSPDTEETFENILIKASYDKLVESIFSDDAETEDRPKGLFNGITAKTLTKSSDIIDMMYNVDKNKGNFTLVISPKAKMNLLKEDPRILDNETLFGQPFIIDTRIKDGFVGYLDLQKLIVCTADQIGVDVNQITEKLNNEIQFIVNSYFDFDYMDKTNLLGVGKY